VNASVHEWGRRLSDAVRAAIDAGKTGEARRLAVEGDGQTRSLAKEYALMYRGLGITIRVIARLLRDYAERAPIGERDVARVEAASLLRGFRDDTTALMAQAYGGGGIPESSARAGTVDDELVRFERFLDVAEDRFDREQSQLAEAIVAALDAADLARARELVDTKEQGQYLPLHDRIIRFMAESFGWVLRRLGPAELLRFHLDTAAGQRRGFDRWEAMPADEFAWTTAFLLKQHMGHVVVREDEEKFTIEQTPCGSGGRLRLAGAYEGPSALPFVDVPGPLTFGERRLAVYCSHCPVWNAVATIAWFGRPHWVFDGASRPDGSCTLHVYKRRDGAPRDYVARLTVPDVAS
jgi:hypothetical protein